MGIRTGSGLRVGRRAGLPTLVPMDADPALSAALERRNDEDVPDSACDAAEGGRDDPHASDGPRCASSTLG